MDELLCAAFCGLLSLISFLISIMSFQEKGILLNNAYLWSSRQERERMDKKPHYRQTAVVFMFSAAIFLCLTAEILLKTGWLHKVVGVLCFAVVVYAIRSSIT